MECSAFQFPPLLFPESGGHFASNLDFVPAHLDVSAEHTTTAITGPRLLHGSSILSFPYYYSIFDPLLLLQSRLELLTSGHLRADGRRPLELRGLQLHIGSHSAGASIDRPDGSATVSHGLTVISACVYGPRQRVADAPTGSAAGGATAASGAAGSGSGGGSGTQDESATLAVDCEIVPWAGAERRKRGKGDRQMGNLAAAIEGAFAPVVLRHLYSRSVISVHISVTEADGSIMAAAVNAVSLALMDAGVAMLEPLVAITVGLYAGAHVVPSPEASKATAGSGVVDEDSSASPGGVLLLDLNQAEEMALPLMTVGMLARNGRIALLELETRMHADRLAAALRLAAEAADALRDEMDTAIKARTSRLARALAGTNAPPALATPA